MEKWPQGLAQWSLATRAPHFFSDSLFPIERPPWFSNFIITAPSASWELLSNVHPTLQWSISPHPAWDKPWPGSWGSLRDSSNSLVPCLRSQLRHLHESPGAPSQVCILKNGSHRGQNIHFKDRGGIEELPVNQVQLKGQRGHTLLMTFSTR